MVIYPYVRALSAHSLGAGRVNASLYCLASPASESVKVRAIEEYK